MIIINISGNSQDRKFRIIQAGLVVEEGKLKDRYNAGNLSEIIGQNICQPSPTRTYESDSSNNSGIEL